MKKFISLIVSLILIITMIDTSSLSVIAEELNDVTEIEQFDEETEFFDSENSESEDDDTVDEFTEDEEVLFDEDNDFLQENEFEEIEEKSEYSIDDKEKSEGSLESEDESEGNFEYEEESVEIENFQENSDEAIENEITASVPYKQETIVDDITVCVRADEGVFPEDSTLDVRRIDNDEEQDINEAIETERDDSRNVAVSYTFDIKVLSALGEEIEPNTTKGKAYVSFKLSEVSDSNLDTDIYHVTDVENPDQLIVEKLNVSEDIDNDTVTVETEGFSFYTVEFTYGDLTYVLQGDTAVALSVILDSIGLSGEVSSAFSSDDELFSIERNDATEWIVVAKQAFWTQEWMKVVIDGVEYTIIVTDDAGDMIFVGDFNLTKYRADSYFDGQGVEKTLARITGEEGINPTSELVRVSQADGDFKATINAWKATHLITNPSGAVQDQIDEKGYYEAIILSVFSEQYKNDDYLFDVSKQVISDTNKILSNINRIIKETDAIDRVMVRKSTFIRDTPIEEQLALRQYLCDSFEEAHPNLSTASQTADIIKTILDSANTVGDAVERIASYGTLCEMGDSTKAVIMEMYEKCPSENRTLKSALKDIADSCNSFNDGVIASIKNATEKQAASLIGTSLNTGWEALVNSNPYSKSFMVGAKLGTFIGDTVNETLFSTNRTVEQYLKMECLVQFDDVARQVAREMGETYKNNRTIENASNFLEALDIVFCVIDLGCDYAEKYCDILFKDSTMGKIVTALSSTQYNKYNHAIKSIGEVRDNYAALKVSFSSWYLYDLEVEHPEIYKLIMGIDDAIPVTDLKFRKDSVTVKLEPVEERSFVFLEPPEVFPYDASTSKEVTYSSSDESILSIGYGWMTAYKAGTVTITASLEDNGNVFTDTIQAKVVDDSTTIEEPEVDNEWDYELINNSYIQITKYNGSDENIIVPERFTVNGVNYPVQEIRYDTFPNHDKITKVVLPDTLTNISNGLFKGCKKIKTITIPDSVVEIEGCAFEQCEKLKKITFGNNLKKIGGATFSGCKSLTKIKIPDSVEELGEYIFEDCEKLESVDIGNGLTTINDGMFRELENLESVKMGDGITRIGDYSFFGCFCLTEISMSKNLVKIGDHAFTSCYNLTSVSFPEGLTEIGLGSFSDCKKIKKIILPKTIRKIGWMAFVACESLEEIDIPDSVIDADHNGEDLFRECKKLKKISLGKGVKWNLTGLTLQCRETLEEIRIGAIEDDAIPAGMFSDYINLKTVSIPNNIYRIEDGAFAGCKKIVGITIPKSVQYIGSSAFYGCSSLETIDLPNGLKILNATLFEDCTNLRRISIPSTVTEIGKDVFKNCSGIKKIDIPDSVTELGKAFDGCGIKEVSIGAGISKLKNGMFSDCIYLNKVVIKYGMTAIGAGAFCGCSSLTNITIPKSVTTIEGNAFNDCVSLEEITLPEKLEKVIYRTFENCNSLKHIEIPESVTSVGISAFSSCDNLEKVIVHGVNTSLGNSSTFAESNNVTIYAHTGSRAEGYAKSFKIPFISLDGDNSYKPEIESDKKNAGNTSTTVDTSKSNSSSSTANQSATDTSASSNNANTGIVSSSSGGGSSKRINKSKNKTKKKKKKTKKKKSTKKKSTKKKSSKKKSRKKNSSKKK